MENITKNNTLNSTPKVVLIKTGMLGQSEAKIVPPLGCMYLAAYLREKLNALCRILDTRLDTPSEEEIGNWIAEDPPLLIGMSVMASESDLMHSLAAFLKKRFPQIPIVVGGPHPSSDMDDVLEDPNIDWLVYNEGEETFLELVEALSKGEKTDTILGTAFCKNEKKTINPPRPFIKDLDALPFPAWDLIDVKTYFKQKRVTLFYQNNKYMPMFSSRACPFRCAYCHKIFGKKFRGRSPENVLAEMKKLYHDYGIREFEFYDDCFNADRTRCKEILRMFADSEMQDASLQFPNGLRADILNDEIIDLLKRARTFSISVAVETASKRIQKNIKKNVKLDTFREITSKLSRKGIFLHCFFMLGFPDETKEELEETLNFALSLEVDTASFFIVNPFKNTELAVMAEEKGLSLNTDPDNYDYLRTSLNLSKVSNEELSKMLRKAYFRFYVSFKRIRKIIRVLWKCPELLFGLIRTFLDRVLFVKMK